MTHRETAPYQKHSETSKEAAASVDVGAKQKQVLSVVESAGMIGVTRDDVHLTLNMVPGAASARLIELDRKKLIVKTAMKKRTTKGCNAYVYVTTGNWIDNMGVAPTPEKKVSVKVKDLEKFRSALLFSLGNTTENTSQHEVDLIKESICVLEKLLK